MRNYKLDTSLLPEVWLTWEKKDGSRIYMNGKNGKRQEHPADWMREYRRSWNEPDDGKVECGCYWRTQRSPRIWVKSGSNLIYAYAKYHADIERLELAVVKYDTTRGEYAHKWEFAGRRFFLGKDKSCLLDDGSEYINGNQQVFTFHDVWSPKYMLRMVTNQHFNDCFVNEIKKFIGANNFVIGNGNVVNIDSAWKISRWYETSQKVRGAGKAQKLTDKLTAIPLSDISGLGEKYPTIQSYDYNYSCNIKNIAYFEVVDDKWCVLRELYRDNNGTTLQEMRRVYISNDGVIRIVSKSIDKWVPSRQHAYRYSSYSYLANRDEAIAKCPRIKYVLSSTHHDRKQDEMKFLITALRFPELEQMCKLGCVNAAKSIARSDTPKAELKDLFGGYYNDKEKNLLRKIGMTKPQLDAYSAVNGECEDRGYMFSEYKQALAEMRKMFGDDLTYLDVDSFSKYLRACKEYRRFKHWNGSYIMDIYNLGIDNARFFKNLVRLMGKQNNIFSTVYDAMNAYTSLRADRRINVDWYFDDVSDAVRVHDALVALRNMQWEEDRARYNADAAERRKKEEEKRKKLDEERKIYEYEDEQFIIRLPKDANEIVTEGSTQHICIGGYVSSHSMGDTNLFFLRRKSEQDKPFYAIEMNNSHQIVQIHGFGNRWLGNNPEAIPTVIRWLRKHGIKCSDAILTCAATGYGQTNHYVAMPVVD